MHLKIRAPLAAVGLLAGLSGCTHLGEVRLDGSHDAFRRYGEARFETSRHRCFEASRRVLEGSHGVERADEAAGTLVSNRKTVQRFMEAAYPGIATATERSIETQLYVTVSGDDASCRVAVTRLRLWRDLREQDYGFSGWTREHLETFVGNVERELAANP